MAKEWRTKIYVTYSRWRTPTFNSYTTHRQYKFAFLSHLLFSMHFIHKLKTNVALHLCIFFGSTKLPHTDYKSWCQNIRNVYIMTIILNGGFTIALLSKVFRDFAYYTLKFILCENTISYPMLASFTS